MILNPEIYLIPHSYLAIPLKASENPVFLKTQDKNGNEVEKFYVRSGNASKEISSLKEINEYINVRFNN